MRNCKLTHLILHRRTQMKPIKTKLTFIGEGGRMVTIERVFADSIELREYVNMMSKINYTPVLGSNPLKPTFNKPIHD